MSYIMTFSPEILIFSCAVTIIPKKGTNLMKKSKLMLFIIGIYISNIYILPSQTGWLVKKNYFPIGENKNGYRSLTDLEVTDQRIVILENFPGQRILIFSKEGKLIKTMGGKEPGKLIAPVEMSLWKDEIAVKDERGFSIFKTDGSFVRRFNPFVNVVSFVYIKDKIYIFTATPDKKSLIDVFSPEGKFLSDFGRGFLKLDYSKYKHMSPMSAKGLAYRGKLLSDGEYLYYLNSTFGKVLVFSLEGGEVTEFNITSIFGDEGEKIVKANTRLWLEKGIDLEKNKIRDPTKELFGDAFLFRDKIYILTRKIIQLKEGFKQENEIKVLDKKSFQLIDSFRVEKNDDEGVKALAVIEKNDEPIFHFTMWVRNKASICCEYKKE